MSVVELVVGNDPFRAQLLRDVLETEGIHAELTVAQDPYVGLDHTSPHRLYVLDTDLDAARSIIADHVAHWHDTGSDRAAETHEKQRHQPSPADERSSRPRSSRSRRTRYIVGGCLVLTFVIPLIGVWADIVRAIGNFLG